MWLLLKCLHMRIVLTIVKQNDMQAVHQLAFVLMNPLDLNIKDGIHIHFNVVLFLYKICQSNLVLLFKQMQCNAMQYYIILHCAMKLKCIRKTTVWLTSYSKTASKKCKHGIEIHKYIVACIGLCTPMQNMIYYASYSHLPPSQTHTCATQRKTEGSN